MSEGWKVVSEEPVKPESGGWSVAYESPSASAVTPENAAGISFKTLVKDPGAALSMLGDRFKATGLDSLKHGSSGGLLGGLLGDALIGTGGTDVYGKTGAQRVAESRATEKAARPEAPKTGLEFLTDLGSGIAYGLAAPESYATLPGKLGIPVAKAGWSVAHPLVAKGVARAAEGAITNAAIDPILQGGNILREQQNGYSPVQTAIAGATGGVLSPALGLAGDVIGIQAARSEAARLAKEAERYAAAQAKTWSVEDLWGGLERQEGARGRMDVTSPKGAKGPGQLMPDTAQYVANKLGRPELAAAALSDDPKLAWANRLLGQTYLKEQLDAFDGDPVLALAAYNAGPGAVRKWVSKFGLPDEMGRAKWIEMIPFGETRNYVKKILGDSAGAPVRLSEPERSTADAYREEFDREMAAERAQAAQQGPDPFAQPKTPEPVQQPAQPVAEVPDPIQQAQQQMTARSDEIAQELEATQQPQQNGTLTSEDPQNAGPSDWQNVTTPDQGVVMGRNYRLTGEVKEVGGNQYVEADWDSGVGGSGRAWMPVSGPDAVPELRAAAERGGIIAPDSDKKSAGPQDWNDPEDFGAEFDRLSKREPTTEAPAQKDLTDEALDIMRSGKAVQVGQGESLIGALVREGGIRDEGGEITNILGGSGDAQLLKRLRRVNTGMPLDDATLWAWQRGYIGKPDGDRPHIQELLDAIGDEAAGKKRYAKHNEEARLVQERIEQLDEMMRYLGVDTSTHSNAEIRAAMDDFMDSASRFDDEPEYRYDEELEPGSFGLGGKGGTNADRVRAKAAGFRIRDMDAIMASTKQNLREQPRAGAVPAKPGEALPTVKGIGPIAKTLLKKLGFVRRQGRVGMAGALGTYNHRTGMIRTKGAQELDVVAHEIGHAVEFTKKFPVLQRTMAAYEPFLQALDYDPMAGRRHEGFAEWFRWYITNPDFAQQLSPGFYRDFEAAMQADTPKDLATMREAQSDYQDFLTAPSVAAARAQVVEPESRGMFNTIYRKIKDKGVMGAVTEFGDEVYRGVFDSLNPWKKAVDAAKAIYERNNKRPLDLRVVEDPYKLLRSMPAVASAGHMDIMYGVHGYHDLDPGSPALADAMKLALGDKFGKWDPQAIRDFGTYLTGRRVSHLYDNYAAGKMDQPPDILSKEFWDQTVADLELANPQYADAAEMVYDWNDALLKKQLDAGLLDTVTYNQIRADHPDYVPLNRDVSDREQVGGKRGSATDKAGGVIRLRGSDRAYMNPIHSMMQRAYEVNTMIARNDALKALDDLGQIMGPDGGAIVERLPPTEMTATRADAMQVLDNAAKEIGVSDADRKMIQLTLQGLFGEKALTNIYRAVDMTPRAGENVVWVWRNGESIPLQLPDGAWGRQMIETLAGSTPPMSNLLLEIAAMPARALRYGVTAHPSFFLANWIRDQFTASVLTDVGYIAGLDNLRGIGADMKQGDLSRRYNVVGGEGGGQNVAAEQRARGERDVQALRTKGKRIRHFASWDGLARFTEVSETGTRLGIFDRAMRKFKKEGMDDWAAAREAGYEARDYMDFERHGGWPGARAAARMIPFFNAALQGLDKTMRVARPGTFFHSDVPKAVARLLFKGPAVSAAEERAVKHAAKLWTVAATLGVGSLALRAAFADDPEYEEIADYLRNTHWVFPVPGTDEYAVIPKPYDVAALSNIMERAFEATTKHDPTAWARLAGGLKDIWVPPIDAPIAFLPLELAQNKDSFGIQIVPESKVGRLPRDQKREGTSPLAIQFTEALRKSTGGKVDLSPAQVEYLAKGVGGTIARDVLRMGQEKAPIDKKMSEMPVISRFVKDWTRGPTSQKEFFKLVATEDGKYSREANSFADLVMAGNTKEATERLSKMDPATRAYVLTSTFAQGPDKQMHPLIRATMVSKEMGELARNLVDNDVLIPGENGLEPLRLTPTQRRAAVDGLRKLQVAEQRNALIATGVPGWAGTRAPLPIDKYKREIYQAAPGVMEALSVRMGVSKIMPDAASYQAWNSVRPMIERQQDPTVLARMIDAKRLGGSGAAERALKTPVPSEPASR